MRTSGIQVKRGGGFTLIELLTVVAIIGLLVGMVVPTVKAVLENSQRMKLLTRINSLSTGCNIYKLSATGNRYYPGQDADPLAALTAGTNTSGRYPNCQNAGSALLSRCLFTDANGLFPTSSYGQLDRDNMLDTAKDPVTGVPRSVIDNSNETMAILYYPARIAQKGTKDQYVANDNSKYVTTANSAASTTIQTHAQKSATPLVMWQDGMFIITAADPKTRLYFDTGAVKNFGTN